MPDDGSTPGVGFRDTTGELTTTGSLGERLLGSLLDRAHLIPPRLVGPLVAQELHRAGAADVSIHLQDFDQLVLQPVLGRGLVGKQVSIDGSPEGRVYSSDTRLERRQPDGGLRLHLPMLDGSDRVGVLSFTLPDVGEPDRELAQRVAGLVADLVVTKDNYTDTFARVRTNRPMSLAAQLQWQSLPPLSMTTPDVELSGILEPAYEVGGDSFDYALDEHVLHLAVFDAMGHGLEAATMATVVLAATGTVAGATSPSPSCTARWTPWSRGPSPAASRPVSWAASTPRRESCAGSTPGTRPRCGCAAAG